ncbi:MAG: nucleotidyltransferase domain-containing protein [Candidatus Aenigmatarchaeota archaeon]
MSKEESIAEKLKKFHFQTRLESAEKLKEKLLEVFKSYIKAIILFGSMARGDVHGKSDVDIYIIFDDTKFPLGKFNEIREKMDKDISKIASSIDPRISVQPIIALTEFWDGIRNSLPLFYTIVRDGYAIYDTGFFIPLRKLLEWGKFPATAEAVEKRMEGAPERINRVKSVKLYMIAEDLYYAVADSAQAVLMYIGVGAPAPKYIGREVRKYLVEEKLLEPEWADFIDKIYEFRKKVEHKELKEISGKELDEWIEKTEKFVKKMEELLLKLSLMKRADEIKKNYEILIKATVLTLKKLDKLPPEPEKLPEAFVKYLVETGILSHDYIQVFNNTLKMRKMVDENKISEIKERDIYLTKEYIRRFVNEVKRIIDAKPEEINKILEEYSKKKEEKEKIYNLEKQKIEEKIKRKKSEEKLKEAESITETAKEIEKLDERKKKSKNKSL